MAYELALDFPRFTLDFAGWEEGTPCEIPPPACCAHAVLSGPAVDRIRDPVLKSVVVTDTIPLKPAAAACKKISVLSISELVGEAIIRSYRGDSVTSLFV